MRHGSPSSHFLRALRGIVRGSSGKAAATSEPVRASFERLEGRTMLSGSPGTGDDAAILRTWWALSGSTHLTLKLAQDAAHRPRQAARPGPARGAYVPNNPTPILAADATTQPTVAVAAAPITAAAVAAPVLPVMPNSDAWYSTIVNANNYIVHYDAYVSPKLKLVTDLVGTSQQTYVESLAATQTKYPETLIGTYHSFRDAQLAATMTSYPRRAVPREGLTSSQILMTDPGNPDVAVVNYSQSAARRYLVKNVVQDVVNTGRPVAFLDNLSHSETGFPISWATTTNVLKEMATNLRNAGKRVIANAAWVPGITSTTSVDQFIATGVDGVSLEMGFHQNVRNSVARINTAMLQYRKMLDAKMTVIFIPQGNATGGEATVENMEIEQRVQAAFGMMFRKPGDKLFVNQLFWRPIQEWTDWTARFGPALGNATVSTNAAGEIVMTRQFTNFKLTLNTTTKEVTYA